MKKENLLYLIVVPILVGTLSWFFYTLSSSYHKGITKPKQNIKILQGNKIKNIELEDYIIGVVACEMPASFEEEALKAQAIASRTYALFKLNKKNVSYDILSTTDDQCYIDEEKMKRKWQGEFDKYYDRIKNIVMSTANVYMEKDNKLFKSFYFSTSNGQTESSEEVFNEVLLESVNSDWDKESKEYKRQVEYSYYELEKILGEFKNIKILNRTPTNHVTKVQVNNTIYSGIEFRKLLNLRSTDFMIEKENNTFIITTYGYGHGVGMSQYGANILAKKGKTYQEILNYYYSGVEFQKI